MSRHRYVSAWACTGCGWWGQRLPGDCCPDCGARFLRASRTDPTVVEVSVRYDYEPPAPAVWWKPWTWVRFGKWVARHPWDEVTP